MPPVFSDSKERKMHESPGWAESFRPKASKSEKGVEEYFFQYWVDIPGKEKRKRETEIIGPVKTMTKSEAERKKLEFIMNLKVNSNEYGFLRL